MSCGFCHLAGAEAPRADADPLDTAVDDRSDELQVRLESPGADVVRVAVLAPYDRSLPAHFTSFGHFSP